MDNVQLLKYATVKIRCNEEIGTALLYSPDESLDYMYILTAKHCLAGKDFDKEYQNTDITIEKIFNPDLGTWYSCNIAETDKIICTESNTLDLALIIIPRSRIADLSGLQYRFQAIDRPGATGECLIRGFADFNSGEEDRPYELDYAETVKDKPEILSLNFDGSLDTRYQSAISNVQGLSGSGLFTIIKGNLFLLGTVHTYEEKNRFFATKIKVFNHLIPNSYALFSTVEPEENDAVIEAFDLIETNNEALKVRTRNTIGSIHIQRDISGARNMLMKNGIVVFFGKAGIGKSAMAKSLIEEFEYENGVRIIAFTAEQLFSSSLNEALIKAGYDATIQQIFSSPLSRQRIVFWIESFEKLVEARFGGAFTELLALVKQQGHIGLVVTIREYFLQKFKIFYQHDLPSSDIYQAVEEFSNEDMIQIQASLPELTPLLENSKLTNLLRTPYYLDSALRILPQLANIDSLDEAEFKRLMWEEIIEAGDRKRGTTFTNIAVRRAMAMELYTFHEPDQITDALVSDNILHVEKGELKNRFVPAHDIFEDWALIREIKQQRQESETTEALLKKLNDGPAMRRAFRLWLEDFYKQDPGQADDFSGDVLLNTDIDQKWKDELTVYILRSEDAYPLFSSLRRPLLEDDGKMLYRFIQLLRTCCKALKKGAEDFDNLIPQGSGWDAMIDFIYANKTSISAIPKIDEVIVEIIIDWGRQLPIFNPKSLPPSARSAAMLLHDYIIKHQSSFGSYRRTDIAAGTKHQAFHLFLQLTSVVQEEVRNLLDAVKGLPALDGQVWKHTNVLVHARDLIVDGFHGEQVSKYFPETVFSLASCKWIEKPTIHHRRSLISLLEIEHGPSYFGLDQHLHYDNASAYQTFFYWIFLYHPDKAVSFATQFINAAFEKNRQGRARNGDSRVTVVLDFKQYGTRSYYGSYDIWTLFRGHSAYSPVIQSLLMALEKGLFELAGQGDAGYDSARHCLETLVINSNNVAVLGVISSVIQMQPKLLDSTTAVLLESRPLLEWDSSRYATDMIDKNYYGANTFLATERRQSNMLAHRLAYHRGLIGFAADYAFFHHEMRAQLFEQFDRQWADAPKEDLMWRKTLTEMDARKYRFEPADIAGYEDHVAIVPDYDDDVAAAIGSFKHDNMPGIGMIWASNVFERKPVEDNSYAAWKRGYEDLAADGDQFTLFTAPGKMACLGLRDYFEQLEDTEKLWCRDKIIELATLQLAGKGKYFGIEEGFMDKGAVLYGVSLLFMLPGEKLNESQVRGLVFQLLTAYIDGREKKELLSGIAENLWETRPGFAMNCWYGLLAFISSKSDQYRESQKERLRGEIGTRSGNDTKWTAELTDSVITDTPFTFGTEVNLNHGTRHFINDVLLMIPAETQIEVQNKFIANFLTAHLAILGSSGHDLDSDLWESRNVFQSFYARYLLSRSEQEAGELFKKLLDITLLDPKEIDIIKVTEYVRDIVKQIILEIDAWPIASRPIEKFWNLWYIFRGWIESTERAYLIPVFLLDIEWYDNVDDWKVLKGQKMFYRDFISKYGTNAINQCIDLLAVPGFRSFMPESTSWLAKLLKYQTTHMVNSSKLERFIHRAFFGYGSQIKDSKQLMPDFLFLLDFLIRRGSPKAYMLKEEMIQYK